MTTKYPVIYEWAGKNFSGYSPDIHGCAATGKTLEGIRIALRSALEAHLQWIRDDGDAIPTPSKSTQIDMAEDKEFQNPKGYYVVFEWLAVTLPKAKRNMSRKQNTKELAAA